jgi:preprotein translocase subunit SecD
VDSKILWRIALIVVVVGLCLWSLYPPGEKIHYGLDLSGGIHLVLQVQTDDAIKAELDDASQRLVSRAREDGVELGMVESNIADLSFTVEVPADTDTAALRQVASDWVPGYKAIPGVGRWTFRLPPNMLRSR